MRISGTLVRAPLEANTPKILVIDGKATLQSLVRSMPEIKMGSGSYLCLSAGREAVVMTLKEVGVVAVVAEKVDRKILRVATIAGLSVVSAETSLLTEGTATIDLFKNVIEAPKGIVVPILGRPTYAAAEVMRFSEVAYSLEYGSKEYSNSELTLAM